MPQDPALPPLFTYQEAIAAGLTRHQIARRVSTGRWVALRRCVFVTSGLLTALPERDGHLLGVVAALRSRNDEDAASHLSGAAVYNWWLPLDGAGPATITRPSGSGSTRRRPGVVVQVASLTPGDTAVIRVRIAERTWSVRTTSRARTVADCLRHRVLPEGVPIGDSALREGFVTHGQIARVLGEQESWPWAARGRRALAQLDPRHESWLESFSFCTLHLCGLPRPEPQVTIADRHGEFVARVDGWLDDEAVVLEPDGRTKYLIGLGPLPDDLEVAADQVAARVRRQLVAQNQREQRLRALGAQVVRWGTAEITRSPTLVAARIRVAQQEGDRAAFTGRTAYRPAPIWLRRPGQRAS